MEINSDLTILENKKIIEVTYSNFCDYWEIIVFDDEKKIYETYIMYAPKKHIIKLELCNETKYCPANKELKFKQTLFS